MRTSPALDKQQEKELPRPIRARLDSLMRKMDCTGTIEFQWPQEPINCHISAGLDAGNIAEHSLRSGMATQSAMNGADERSIARVTQYKSMRVLRCYIREGGLFCNNASGRPGL